MRKNDYGIWNWNYETHQKATGFFFYIKCLLPSNFFIAILITMRLLSTLFSVTAKLQNWSLDIISAYEQSEMFKMRLSCLGLILMRNFIPFLNR